jgi:septal ring factor EnvC (AmiA/AmiB activator)
VTGPNEPESEAPRQPETETDQWKFPTWRRVGDFVSNVFQLERNIASLKEDNKRLREELKAIQRQTNEQEGQLKVLLNFVQTALNEQVDSRAERAAVERMVSFRGERPPEIE